MSARVTYWTGTWDPGKEAISKEVQALRMLDGEPALVVSFSSGQRGAVDVRNRVIQLSSRSWPLLRIAAPFLERTGRINHVFGGLDSSWPLLRSIRRRPIVFTVVMPGLPADMTICKRVDHFVVEDETLARMLLNAGISERRIHLIYPGVDLRAYTPAPVPANRPFRVLFASSPADAGEFELRGIPLLVEAAKLCPDVEFVLLWREWGNVGEARRALDRLAPPANLKMEQLNGRGMPAAYRDASAVACLYAPGFGKSCPNSIVEGLACGVPALVAESCGIAALIERHGAGLAAARDPRAVANAVWRLRASHGGFAKSARALAERAFDAKAFVSSYAGLYDHVAQEIPGRAVAVAS